MGAGVAEARAAFQDDLALGDSTMRDGLIAVVGKSDSGELVFFARDEVSPASHDRSSFESLR